MKHILLKILIILFFCFDNSISKAQFAKEKKVVYGEGGGAALVGSINYDSRFSNKSNLGFGFRIGIGGVPGQKLSDVSNSIYIEDPWKISIPIAINYLFGNEASAHTFELGVQSVYIPKNTVVENWSGIKPEHQIAKNRIVPSLYAGYRRQPIKDGFLWRFGFSPFEVDNVILMWFGASLGWKF